MDGGRWLAALDDDGVRLFDVTSGQEVAHDRHTLAPNLQQGGIVFRGDDGLTLAINQTATRSRLVWLKVPGLTEVHARDWSGVATVAIAAAGTDVLTADTLAQVRLWREEPMTPVTEFPHAVRVRAVAVSAKLGLAATAADDGRVRVWRLTGGVEPAQVLNATADLPVGDWTGVWISDECRQVVAVSQATAAVWAWPLDQPNPTGTPAPLPAGATATAVTRGGLVCCGTAKGELIAWDVDRRQEVGRYRGHAGPVTRIAVSNDGNWACTASADRTGRVYRLPTAET